ncbi:hypothetical protein SKAU_G00384490 [Synaphobranchus kaupii]|uniref:C-type lectin domain-containing protein n=1 Tax=Synaphobranchus kaupii TaxID=118154 RepID=A0A9Q1IF06_SYNKA|nr:hypothetical protein SKAU_G00384490 [Synaphobranchus kaupii]
MVSFTLPAFLCVAVLSSMTLAGTEICQGPCIEGWVHHDQRCFHYCPKMLSWIDAERRCVSIGGNLASEHTLGDHDFLKKLQMRTGEKHPFWIGLSYMRKEATWIWSDGTKMDFKKWNYGEPKSSGGKEHCVLSNWGAGKAWKNVSCHRRYPFVCSKRLH